MPGKQNVFRYVIFIRRGWNEVGMYLCVMWMNLKGVTRNSHESPYDIKQVHV